MSRRRTYVSTGSEDPGVLIKLTYNPINYYGFNIGINYLMTNEFYNYHTSLLNSSNGGDWIENSTSTSGNIPLVASCDQNAEHIYLTRTTPLSSDGNSIETLVIIKSSYRMTVGMGSLVYANGIGHKIYYEDGSNGNYGSLIVSRSGGGEVYRHSSSYHGGENFSILGVDGSFIYINCYNGNEILEINTESGTARNLSQNVNLSSQPNSSYGQYPYNLGLTAITEKGAFNQVFIL